MTAMTLRISDADHAVLRAKAEAEGVSMQHLLHRALEAYLHRDRVIQIARQVMIDDAEAIKILGT